MHVRELPAPMSRHNPRIRCHLRRKLMLLSRGRQRKGARPPRETHAPANSRRPESSATPGQIVLLISCENALAQHTKTAEIYKRMLVLPCPPSKVRPKESS